MLDISDLRVGVIFVYNDQPYEILEAKHSHLGRGGAVLQTRIKNLKTGVILSQNFKPGETFDDADVSRETVKFLYFNRDQYWFAKTDNPSNRFFLKEEQIGENKLYLQPNSNLEALFFDEEPINISLPIKMDLKVVEAPPGVKGDTAQGGTKTVVLETGAKVQTPLFIGEGDVIRVNTRTGEYVERAEKAK